MRLAFRKTISSGMGISELHFSLLVLFLELNGIELVLETLSAVRIFFALAAGRVTEQELAAWLRKTLAELNGSSSGC